MLSCYLLRLDVISAPKIMKSSRGDICTTINSSESLHCLFNATTMEGVTIVVWSKDKSEISGYDNKTVPVSGENNEVLSKLNIKNISHKDEGTYTCYCKYNSSIVTSDKLISSDNAVMFVNTDCSGKGITCDH